ncbi:MAG: saccharopine dehydrogenase [Candidatus Latescibacteria bacterium]|nr:saccharopine dehydrogenase [Candidatus Latescibacterota bacterium]NIO56747.1 saccharopine dehydrogenase [Candidatus Latescibacterota bacterium]NIT02332.1 saccharopine dehydrogenase [Candidatus Latescibacterota bacterium]NIT39215.1 saccharopine dehydrogenase [Candidatus Latescibacterota bacterium]
MAKVVVFGAGMVTRPLVRYLLDQPDIHLTVATRTVSKAERMIAGHPKGEPKSLNVQDMNAVEEEIKASDVVVSLLPYEYHVKVANRCIKHKKHLVTTSYVSEAMQDLDAASKKAGVLLLNECGLDPGIDHMSAMRIIHDVERKNGKVVSFRSTTGALPSHETNNNPFGYKFSWSPRGVLLASKNAAKWLENGEEVNIPGEQLFENYYIQDVPGVGAFENYPNRDSIPYKEIYGLKDAHTVYRGTFRMTGWCETLRKIVAIGWLSENPPKGFAGKTYGELTRHLINAAPEENLHKAAAKFLGIDVYAAIVKRLEWLGLFGDEPLPQDRDNPLDYMNVLTLEKMPLRESERDMIVMHHEFVAEYANSKREYITSTLVDYGIPGEDSSIARTVSLPAAIAVKMILYDKITATGVHIPISPGIYNPILDELESYNVIFKERTQEV